MTPGLRKLLLRNQTAAASERDKEDRPAWEFFLLSYRCAYLGAVDMAIVWELWELF